MSSLKNPPDLSISIVTWNVKEFIDISLESIYKNTKDITFEVLVADNNSSDGTSVMIKSKYPDVILTQNTTNLYFVKATNQNLLKSSGRYVAIHNPDTVMVNNAYVSLVKFMENHPECGACGPMLLNPDGSLQKNGVRFPGILYGFFQAGLINTLFPKNPARRNYEIFGWDGLTLREVDYVSGAALLIRREVMEKTGYLDENITMYWEDADICRRIKSLGYKIFFVPEAKLVHHWGEAAKKKGKQATEKIFNRSMVYYYKKHHGMFVSILLRFILFFFTAPLLRLLRTFK
ncbi:MAG: glycosyltransferase family 2 protein [Elusimicrobiota bacterium]